MSASCSLKILEISQIKQSPESSSNPSIESTLPLTCFDIFWFKIPPVERVFFYELNELTSTNFTSRIIPKLKQSLSLTLHHYLPLTGKLKWPSNAHKPFVSYTPNDGVSLTVAESDACFDRLSSDGIYKAVELHPLIPRLITSHDSASILAIQITLFPYEGFSIGITAHHTVLDGKTTTMFMKSWAYMCKQGHKQNPQLPQELTPVFDRGVIKVPTGLDLDMLYLNQWLTYSSGNKSLKLSTDEGAAPDLVRATVTLTPDDLKKMRERVSKNSHVSAFVLTFAYVASCIVKARGGKGDRIVCLGLTADCRARLQPPIPQNYFGNCNTGLLVLPKASDLIDIENGFGFAVEKVSDMVKGLTKKGVYEGAENRLTPIFEIGKEPAGSVQLITIAGSPLFGLYEVDFGWRRPSKVVVVSIDKNEAISMAESRDEDKGIEVGLALNEHEMDRFLSMFLKDVSNSI